MRSRHWHPSKHRFAQLVKSAYYEGAHDREGQTAGDSSVEFDDSNAAEKLRAALA